MRRAAFVWTTLVVAVFAWTCLSYAGQPDPALQNEISLRHFVINALISGPTSLILGLAAEGVLGPYARDSWFLGAVSDSAVSLTAGYIQWVIVTPRVLAWWKRRRREGYSTSPSDPSPLPRTMHVLSAMKARYLVVAALASALLAATLVALPHLRLAREASVESALRSLEQQIVDGAEQYHRRHRTPPNTPEDLELDLSLTDGATSEMLRCFRIEVVGSSYRVAREPSCPK